MAKGLLHNEAAEREANDVAFKFMNSSDVVGDMKRAYTGRLDRVRLHDDASADARVSAQGRDGIASGSDIYLKQGLLSDKSPETNGLIAHEMAHTMQQSGESAGMSQSVSYGEEQGGLLDWFRSRRMKISEPKLQKMVSHTAGKTVLNDEYKADFSGISDPKKREEEMEYQDFLASDVNHIDVDRAHDPKIQQRALHDFIEGGRGLMANEPSQKAALTRMRGAVPGMRGLSHVLGGLMHDTNDQIYQFGQQSMQGVDLSAVTAMRQGAKSPEGRQAYQQALTSSDGKMNDTQWMDASSNVSFNLAQQEVEREGSDAGALLGQAMSVFEGTPVQDKEQQSAYMMNMLMNRVVQPAVSTRARTETDETAKARGEEYSRWLELGSKFDFDKSLEGHRRQGFLSTLKRRFSGS